MEVRENNATASVDNRKPRSSSCAVVFHEGWKRRAGRLLVVTENDRKLILELVHAQLLEGILMRSFEDGLDPLRTPRLLSSTLHATFVASETHANGNLGTNAGRQTRFSGRARYLTV